jgi:hypothetical protein
MKPPAVSDISIELEPRSWSLRLVDVLGSERSELVIHE